LRADIRIARVIARLNVGGPSIQAVLMTEAFRSRGYRSDLLVGTLPEGESGMDHLAREHGVQPICIAQMSRRISYLKDIRALLRLISFFRREKPTIVHTHTAKAGALGRLAALATGVPVRVHTFHGHVFKGYFSKPVTRIFLAIERFLARHTDRIICISESQRRDLVEVYRIASADKIVTIPLGFEVDCFQSINGYRGILRAELGCGSCFLVGWIGRLTDIKAPSRFLKLAARLRDRYPQARFVMIGDGELRPTLEREADEQGLRPVLKFAGWRKDLADIYADLDLVVLTSMNEGTPIVLLEAMAAGKSFVATDVGGVQDLAIGVERPVGDLRIFDNGILTSENDETLANAVEYMINNLPMRTEMGKRGREFVRQRYSSKRLADDLEALYLYLIDAKGAVHR
jgi:glycosyltransferase involved in cell wall biosynthesis